MNESGAGGSERPPSWQGAPGYTPHPELPAHSPMPGAPPYPAWSADPPQPARRSGSSYARVMAATVIWAVVHLVLVTLDRDLVSPVAFAAGLVVSTFLASLAGWWWVRHRPWPFWLLVLAVAPVFWVLRAVIALPLG